MRNADIIHMSGFAQHSGIVVNKKWLMSSSTEVPSYLIHTDC